MFLDVTAPTVTSYSPLDNATNVVTTVELVVIFNETVTLGTSGTISLKKTSDNSTIDSWDVPADNGSGAGQLQVVSGTELHMHLTTALANSTEYYVVWPAGVIKDTTGNGVAAQSSTTLWSFTTAAAAPAWTPLLASTPAMFWVDATNAASITKTGTAPNEIVTAWNDLTSGTPHNLTPGINGGPVYVASAMNSKPGISFINNGSLNTVSFTTPPPIMVVIVWRQTAALGAANAMLFESDTISHTGFIIFNRFNSSTYKVVVQSGNYLDNGTITANTNYHSRFLIDGSTSSSTLNGSTVSGIINGWDPITTGLTLGNVDSASNGPNAIICEAFIIKYADHAAAVANAPTDATNAAAYVLAKWGV
jgi:hypothetical protein